MKLILKRLVILFILISISFEAICADIKILYKVNEEIITTYDIEIESNYLKTLNLNLKKIPKKDLYQTATQSLIREKIKKKEINRVFEIDYERAIYSNSINDIINNFYSNLGFASEDEFDIYLKKNDVSQKDLREKFVVEQFWNQLIVNKYNNSIQIDENKINKKIDDLIKSNKEVNIYNLSEIVFFEKNKQENEIKFMEIQKSIKEIGFEETAILYSISESSKLGGKIGWIKENQISKKIFDAINGINIGEYSEIINTAGGNIILKLNDKKKETNKINREEEIKKLIRFEKNKLYTEYSIIYYKELENKAYVEKL